MTPQQTIDQQNQLISKLTKQNKAIEDKFLLACKEVDLLTKQLNDTWNLVNQYNALSNGLAQAQEGGVKG